MRKHTEMLRDPRAYMESIGKEDGGRRRMFDALQDDGRDAVVRVCFSVPDRHPPLRALGYFAAAAHVAQKYLPQAQLQFVATVHANARINNVPLDQAKKGAWLLFDMASRFTGITPNDVDVVYGFDTAAPPEVPMHRIIPIMRNETISKHLARSASRRKAHYAEYLGAHLVLHDVVDVVDPVLRSSPVAEAKTLISIGAQSERAFYTARHICRSAPSFDIPGMVESTAQLFTRHVYPPYAYLRHGVEGGYDPPLITRDSVRQLEVAAPDPFSPTASILRDLLYVQDCLQGSEERGFLLA